MKSKVADSIIGVSICILIVAFLVNAQTSLPVTVTPENIVLRDPYGNIVATSLTVALINNTDGYVQLARMLIESGTSYPTVPAVGYLYYRTDLNALYFYNGTAWTACSGGGGGIGSQDFSWQGSWNLTVADLITNAAIAWSKITNANVTVQQLITLYQNFAWQGSWNATVSDIILNAAISWSKITNANTTVNQLIAASSISWSQITNANATVAELVGLYQSFAWQGAWNSTVVQLASALTNLNVSGWVNSTSINALGYYLNNNQLGFVDPATFIIDVSGSTYRAWYGANSTLAFQSVDASAVINNAFGNLTSGRAWQETVVLKNNITVTSTLLIPSYTHLDIQGQLILGNTLNINMIENSDQTNGNVEITISGGTIDANKDNNLVSSTAIYFVGVNRSRIEDCSLQNIRNSSIFLVRSNFNVVSRNHIRNYGLSETGYGIWFNSYCSGNTGLANVINDGGYGIGIKDASCNNTITGNTVNNMSIVGIDVYGHDSSPHPSWFNTVSGNTVSQIGANGIRVSKQAWYNTITGNTVTHAAWEGIVVSVNSSYNVFSSNLCVNNTQRGFSLSSAWNTVIGNVFANNGWDGIQINVNYGGSVKDNDIYGNGLQAIDSWDGIYLAGGYCQITGNKIYGSSQRWCIYETGADYNFISDNYVTAGASGAISPSGSHTVVKNNFGFVTENSGSATITVFTTTVTVTHGLAGTPTSVRITATSDLGGRTWWVSSKGATTFVITISSADLDNNLSFDWEAEYQP